MRNQATFLHEIYEFEGSPYEIGFNRGKLMAPRLREAIKTFAFGDAYHGIRPTPEQYNLDYYKENYPSQFNKWEKTLGRTPKWFQEECRGNAEGAGVPYEKLIISPRWFPFIMRKEKTDSQQRIPQIEDCNGFMAHGKATAGGRVFTARRLMR